MRALALLLLLFALPATAQEARLPALFSVTGVAADDVLNVRAAPGTAGEIIGTLAPDATDVEVVALDAGGRWGQVNLGEIAGWAAMRFLDRQPGHDWGDVPAIRVCYGAEPFWSLDLRPARLGFSTPVESLSIEVPEIAPVGGRREPWTLITDSDHGPLYGILSREICSDGMSEALAGYRLDLIQVDRGSFTGCCTLAR
ncbi:SH3 domain-containing protein [Jannaschia marina]|uniref:SH3 domain-containing protein n=1 Tax=Jannaschia marina TaxID=2741674 RepID=UPI0015CD0A54|nr:SH3 domain-containing protein [Jannaschia marina]